jgi:hypothetical protein
VAARSGYVSMQPVRTLASVTGGPPRTVGITFQCWDIAPKIRDVDALITPTMQKRIVVMHLEVSFTAMNGRWPRQEATKGRSAPDSGGPHGDATCQPPPRRRGLRLASSLLSAT